MKAIALLRLGRGEEGGELVNKIIQTKPGDSATLQAVFWYCREVGDCECRNERERERESYDDRLV